MQFDCWVVPKGAPHRDAAMKLLAYIGCPEVNGRLALFRLSGPANQDAFATGVIPPEQAAKLPNSPANLKNAILFDDTWWSEHIEEATKRFDRFLQE